MSKKYNKKSLYHTDRKRYYAEKAIASQKKVENVTRQSFLEGEGEKVLGFSGGNHWSPRSGRSHSTFDFGGSSSHTLAERFPNLVSKKGIFNIKGGYISAQEAIWLCQKAWQEVQIFRNTIEAMVEFSVSNVSLSSKNARAKKFCETWIKSIKVRRFSEQFYRELYRSCNLFIASIYGEVETKSVVELGKLFGADSDKIRIPVKYTILNPAQISLFSGISSDREMYKALSPYEIERLKNPKTVAEKEMYEALDPEIKEKLEGYGGVSGSEIYIPLKDVNPIFYQKQDYEYFATPLFYGVLDDIELKLEMKAADRTVLASIENMIMLITMGGMKDSDGAQIPPNPEHVKYMRELFASKKAQRILVADFTTKIEYVIPDLKKVVGRDKYEQVNQDIREGLQTIFGSDEKFANQMTKVQIFIEKLEKGREVFKDWLESEIATVCKEMGFKDAPTVNLDQINLRDENQLYRVYTRLCEIGILTPEEAKTAIETGVLPKEYESIENQKKLLEHRKENLYFPQIFNNQPNLFSEDNEGATTQKAPAPQGAVNSPGRPVGSGGSPISVNRTTRVLGSGASGISMKLLQDNFRKFDQFKIYAREEMSKAYKVKSLTKGQEEIVDSFVSQIVQNNKPEEWESAFASLVKNKEYTPNTEMNHQVNLLSESLEISDPILSALTYHSIKEFPDLEQKE